MIVKNKSNSIDNCQKACIDVVGKVVIKSFWDLNCNLGFFTFTSQLNS